MRISKYVKIPIDPYAIKQKVFMGLTKRQLISFVIGGACGIIPFFVVKALGGTVMGAVALFISAFPAIMCGMYSKNGIHLEDYAKLIFRYFTKPKRRTYKSHNVAEYAELMVEKQQLEKRLRNG